MVKLVDLGKKENLRRSKLSKFALCIDDAELFIDHGPLAKLILQPDFQLTADDKKLLADYLKKIEPRVKQAGRGRLKYKPLIRLDWVGLAGMHAKALLFRWKRLTKGRRKVKLNGKLVKIREAVCERMAARYGHPNEADRLEEYLRH
jgi:hypothetical protein